jgi:hypothetical protein
VGSEDEFSLADESRSLSCETVGAEPGGGGDGGSTVTDGVGGGGGRVGYGCCIERTVTASTPQKQPMAKQHNIRLFMIKYLPP